MISQILAEMKRPVHVLGAEIFLLTEFCGFGNSIFDGLWAEAAGRITDSLRI
jgi:hypothetical protein